mmetsp:Transcript_28037/g.41598  ORF Transcript_28037/g.41598 Transcript_28037/m.41598 type:complete len:234 (+) Transcript_28037:932-1633(+)
MYCGMRTVVGPASSRSTASFRRCETRICSHIRHLSHLINFFGFVCHIITKIQIIIPISQIIITKIKIVKSSIKSASRLWFVVNYSVIPSSILRHINCILNHLVLNIFITTFKVLQGGLLNLLGRPLGFFHDWSRRLKETSGLLVGHIDILKKTFHRSTIRFNRHLNPFGISLKSMQSSTDESKWQISTLFKNLDTLSCISKEQSIMITSHNISPHIGDFKHLLKLGRISSNEI